jgi:Ca2+-binding RTX toxin-like protein
VSGSTGGAIEYSSCDNTFFGTCDNYDITALDEAFNVVPAGCMGTTSTMDCNPQPINTVVNGSVNADAVDANCGIFGDGSDLTFNAGSGDDEVETNCGSDFNLGSGNDTGVGNGTLRGDAGNDALSSGSSLFGSFGSTLIGGAGRDTLIGRAGNDTLDGGDDNDRLEAGAGNDSLKGGNGRDMLLPGLGTDAVIEGGDGVDTVSYEDVTSDQGLSLSINGAADDGAPNEKDNIGADIENITGSPSPDNIIGSDGVNVIEGDAGNDTIDPLKGNDFVSGGSGDDVITTRDGEIDAVNCGDGNDRLTSDEFDSVANCETVQASRELMPDVDNDGLTTAAGDCDDRDNRRRPGYPDKPQNKVDEDCDGKDAPYLRINTGTQTAFTSGSVTVINRYKLIDIPAGAKVQFRCKRGKRSCLKTRSRTYKKGAGTVNARKVFKLNRLRLRPGSLFEVRITNTDSIGKVVQYPIRRGAPPVSRLRCLPPGAKSPRKC